MTLFFTCNNNCSLQERPSKCPRMCYGVDTSSNQHHEWKRLFIYVVVRIFGNSIHPELEHGNTHITHILLEIDHGAVSERSDRKNICLVTESPTMKQDGKCWRDKLRTLVGHSGHTDARTQCLHSTNGCRWRSNWQCATQEERRRERNGVW